MDNKVRVALIYGSTRKGRFCDKVAAWAAQEIRSHGGFSIDAIDPAVDGLEPQFDAESRAGASSLWQRVAEADAFVIVTPEYNHGYPAPLKELIDSVGAEWHAKPVAFVSYGGVSGGLRAVEQLRAVFTELHAVTIRDSVSFAGAQQQFDDAGTLTEPERAERSMARTLARLRWWATTLNFARATSPYPATV